MVYADGQQRKLLAGRPGFCFSAVAGSSGTEISNVTRKDERMHLFASSLFRKVLLAAAAAFLTIATPLIAQDDPPAQAGRLSYITGNVTIQQVGSDDWGQALPNLPFGPGDRVVTDRDGRAEIQIGQIFVRIGPNSDVSFVEDSATSISIGLAQGSIHAHCIGLWPGQRLHINTPSGSGGVDAPGEELRVDVLPNEGAAIFTNLGVQAFAGGPGIGAITLHAGQAVELLGSNPVVPQWLRRLFLTALISGARAGISRSGPQSLTGM